MRTGWSSCSIYVFIIPKPYSKLDMRLLNVVLVSRTADALDISDLKKYTYNTHFSTDPETACFHSKMVK